MGLLISKSDFVGKYKIAQNSFSNVDAYIDLYEERYLAELMGADLFALFKADVNPTTKQPVTAIYLNLYNGFKIDSGSCLHISDGLKNMVLGFLFFDFLRDDKFKATISGQVVGSQEVNREAGFDEFYIYGRYNESVSTYQQVQWYIGQHLSDYPNFNGQYKSHSHWAL